MLGIYADYRSLSFSYSPFHLCLLFISCMDLYRFFLFILIFFLICLPFSHLSPGRLYNFYCLNVIYVFFFDLREIILQNNTILGKLKLTGERADG